MTTTAPAPPRTRPDVARSGAPVDIAVAAGVVALVLVARWWGLRLVHHGAVLLLAAGEPLAGPVRTRTGHATVAALVLAVAYVLLLPQLSARLRWPALLAGSAVCAAAWSVTLALVDGVQNGLVARLTGKDEYLHDLHRFTGGPGNLLHTFAGRVSGGGPQQWATHVGGHPPGALLTFWTLDRLGLGGGGWAAALCVAGGALAVPAVLLTVRSVADERIARAAAPFLVVAPAAVWIAASADAWFLGVTAWGVACLALGAERRSDALALVGGLLLGYGCYLSYGLLLLAPLAVAVVLLRRGWRTLVLAALGVAAVVLAFAAGGFWWLDGLSATRARVEGGAAAARPYGYFLVANVAALAIAVGPATVAGLVRLRGRSPLRWLALPALAGIAFADLTGLSRGEVERIWLPFMPWLIVAAALLPTRHRRGWLAAQLAVGITVQTLVVSLW